MLFILFYHLLSLVFPVVAVAVAVVFLTPNYLSVACFACFPLGITHTKNAKYIFIQSGAEAASGKSQLTVGRGSSNFHPSISIYSGDLNELQPSDFQFQLKPSWRAEVKVSALSCCRWCEGPFKEAAPPRGLPALRSTGRHSTLKRNDAIHSNFIKRLRLGGFGYLRLDVLQSLNLFQLAVRFESGDPAPTPSVHSISCPPASSLSRKSLL